MTTNFQNEKNLIREYYKALDSAKGNDITKVLQNYISEDYIWRGFHPFNEIRMPRRFLKFSGSHFVMHLKIFKDVWIFSLQEKIKLTDLNLSG